MILLIPLTIVGNFPPADYLLIVMNLSDLLNILLVMRLGLFRLLVYLLVLLVVMLLIVLLCILCMVLLVLLFGAESRYCQNSVNLYSADLSGDVGKFCLVLKAPSFSILVSVKFDILLV